VLLRVLAERHRLAIVSHLYRGEMRVGELAATLGCPVPRVSQHLARLRECGLVAARHDVTTVYYRLSDQRVAHLVDTVLPAAAKVGGDRQPPVTAVPPLPSPPRNPWPGIAAAPPRSDAGK